jgi:hypothetical protein
MITGKSASDAMTGGSVRNEAYRRAVSIAMKGERRARAG